METHAGNGRDAPDRFGKRRTRWPSAETCGAPSLKSLAPALFLLLYSSSANLLHAQDPAPPPEAGLAQVPSQATTQTPAPVSFEIGGIVKAGKTPLPGVTVTASNTLTGKKFTVATAANG